MIAVSGDDDYGRNPVNAGRRFTISEQGCNSLPPDVNLTLEIIRHIAERRRKLAALHERFGGHLDGR